jgi:hypothetical protein
MISSSSKGLAASGAASDPTADVQLPAVEDLPQQEGVRPSPRSVPK